MAITTPIAKAITPVIMLITVIAPKDPIAKIANGEATINPMIPQ